MATKILIAEDDFKFQIILKKILEGQGYLVSAANNGEIAKELLKKEHFDLVISDANMPIMSGFDLLNWMKENKPVPFILMTGESTINKTQDAYALGIKGFLPKPFTKEDVLETIRQTLQKEEDGGSEIDSEFCKISIKNFFSGFEIPFNIYIRVGQNKFIKVAHSGEDLDLTRIKSYEGKQVEHLYLKRTDFKAYADINISFTRGVKASSKIPADKKKKFVSQMSQFILSKIYDDKLDDDTFSFAKEYVELATSVLADDDDAFELMSSLQSGPKGLYEHSLAVSMYTTMIQKKMGMTSPAIVIKGALCGLFHDIGEREFSDDLRLKSRGKMTHADTKIYETHTTRGYELITAVKSIPSEVACSALQHHENCLGTGFPKQLTRDQIHPIARIVMLANDFCNQATFGNIKPDEIITKMATFKNHYETDALLGLLKIFNLNPWIIQNKLSA